jgi:cation diffusion facilitator family transporter
VLNSSVLILAKAVVWTLSGSVSVLAEALHSSADLIGSALALVSVRFADDPPDAEHAYGHGKFENMSGMLIALLVFCAGIGAIAEAVQHFDTHHRIIATTPALVIMGLSVLSNAVVSRNLFRVGRETDSPALTADGFHLQTDVITSTSVFLGLILVKITGYYWIDPAAALLVSGFIFTTAFRIARDSVVTLSDASLPDDEEEVLRCVLTRDPNVMSFHKLRTRKSGSHRHVDVHIQIDDTHTFVAAHQIAEDLEDKMRRALPNLHPMIHIEPYEDEVARQAEEEKE